MSVISLGKITLDNRRAVFKLGDFIRDGANEVVPALTMRAPPPPAPPKSETKYIPHEIILYVQPPAVFSTMK